MEKVTVCGKRLAVLMVVALLCTVLLSHVRGQDESRTVLSEDKEPKTLANQGYYGGTLKVAIQSTPNLNPTTATGDNDWAVMNRIYDSLGILDSSVPKVEPWLAESWTVTDDTHIQVTLKSSVNWHDGQPVTGDDVKYTFETGLKSNARFSRSLGHVSGVTPSGNTLTIALDVAYAPFINEAMLVPIIPKHKWQSGTDSTLVGCGPFKFKQLNGNIAELNTNADYFKGRPYVDGINFIPYPYGANSTKYAIENLTSGNINLVGWGVEPFNVAPSLTKNADLGFFGTYFNVRNTGINMNDIILRRAIARCVDKTYLLTLTIKSQKDAIGGSVICPANSLWSVPVENYYTTLDADGDGKVTDQEKLDGLGPVRDTLLNAGYINTNADGYLDLPGSTPSDVKWLNISVLIPSTSLDPVESAQIDSRIADNMRYIGLNAVTDTYSSIQQYNQKISSRDFDICFGKYTPPSIDPGFIYDLFDSANDATMNLAGYSNSTFDTLIEREQGEGFQRKTWFDCPGTGSHCP